MLAEETPTDCNVQEVVADTNVQFGAKEEEEERGKPPFITLVFLKFCRELFKEQIHN